jgi:hypothetical protein
LVGEICGGERLTDELCTCRGPDTACLRLGPKRYLRGLELGVAYLAELLLGDPKTSDEACARLGTAYRFMDLEARRVGGLRTRQPHESGLPLAAAIIVWTTLAIARGAQGRLPFVIRSDGVMET